MKTISLKTAQSKFKNVIKLSDLLERSVLAFHAEIANTTFVKETDWLTNGHTGKAEEFLLKVEEPFKVQFSQDGSEFEGYLSGYVVKWNENKKDWYVYCITKVRPTMLDYHEDKEDAAKLLFQAGVTMIIHRKYVHLAENGEAIKRPNTKSINQYLKK